MKLTLTGSEWMLEIDTDINRHGVGVTPMSLTHHSFPTHYTRDGYPMGIEFFPAGECDIAGYWVEVDSR